MKSQTTGVWLYVPDTFNIKHFERKYHRLENECHWLLHRILVLNAYYRHSQPDYISISRHTMQQFIHPSDVDIVRDFLITERVIACDGAFAKGGKSLGYQICEPYAGEIHRVEVTKTSLAAKIKAHRLSWIDRPIAEQDLQQVHQHLFNWLRRTKIDTETALATVDAMADKPKTIKPRLCRKTRARCVKNYVAMINHKTANRMTIEMIDNGDWDFKVCPYGRVHTPVTRLLSEVRPCLSIDNEPLVNLDVVNSQMIFFALLLLEERLAGFSELPSHQLDTSSDSPISLSPLNQILQEPKHPKESGILCPHTQRSTSFWQYLSADEGRFVELVMGGHLYEYLMKKATENTADEAMAALVRNRKAFKGRLFRDVFYGDSAAHYSRTSKLAAAFKSEFPGVWGFILEQKAGGKDAFKELAQKMQRRESQFMINTVCARLAKHHAEIPALTIHDSILTTPAHAATVERIMHEEFARLGVSPQIRVEQAIQHAEGVGEHMTTLKAV